MSPPGAGSPEQRARQLIDAALAAAGWGVQDRQDMNLSAGQGVAIREFPLAPGHGYADYLLFVDGKAVGVLEAKPEGHTLSGVEPQAGKYAAGLPGGLKPPVKPLPFLYLSTGSETKFTNLLDPVPRSRGIFHVHRPETLAEWLAAESLAAWTSAWTPETAATDAPADGGYGVRPASLRARLRAMPPAVIPGLWPNQIEGIHKLERSFYDDKP
jgi:type I restriction enzyme R subunit